MLGFGEVKMHHMKVRQMKAQEAKAKRNGYYKPPPPTAEEQARIAMLVNQMLAMRQNVQLQLI